MSAKNHFIDFPLFDIPEYGSSQPYGRGENQHKVLVIISSSEDTEDLNTFLAKILSAVKLDLQKDILLLSVPPGETLHLSSIIRRKEILHVINFGISARDIGVHLQTSLYQPVMLSTLQLIFAHSLTDIYQERQQGGKQKAAALWRGLQKLFVQRDNQ